MDFPHSLAFFALDNLSRTVGVPKVSLGTFGAYGLVNNLISFPIIGGWLGGALFGYRYFTEAYRDRIVEIIVEDSSGDLHTGTGFFLRSVDGLSRVITCKHNLVEDDGNRRKIQSISAGEQTFNVISGAICKNLDAAIITVDGVFTLDLPNAEPNLLDTIYSAGFPRIFLTEKSPLLFHKGEINGFSGSFDNGSIAIVVSTDVAPGNSGGPVFDSVGRVVAMVVRRVETQSLTGMAKYVLAIPISAIMRSFNENLVEPF